MKSRRWNKRVVLTFMAIALLCSVLAQAIPLSNKALAVDTYPIPATINDCDVSGGGSFLDSNNQPVDQSQGVKCGYLIGRTAESDVDKDSVIISGREKCAATTMAVVSITSGGPGMVNVWCAVLSQESINATKESNNLKTEEATLTPLWDLLCSKYYSIGGTVEQACLDEVKATFNECTRQAEQVGGTAGKEMGTAKGMATCLAKTYKDVEKSELEKAVQKGYDAAEELNKSRLEEEAKAKCESLGKVYDPDNSDADESGCVAAATATTDSPSCNLGAMGWIICPTTQLIEYMVGGLLSMVTAQMQFNAILGANTSQGMFNGWSAVRDIANIAFAIAFMIIIYSTATSSGLTNYSIKKILPRLIVAAILVNISFWICAAAVDLSNILGSSIKTFIDVNMTNTVDSGSSVDNRFASSIQSFAGGILGGGITLVGGLVAGVMLWATALIAILTLLTALAFRTFALVALIVISPLAFVAYLLPNTESWFKKWRTEFMRMLFAYPMVAAVWGLSNFLTAVLQQDGGALESGGLTFVDAMLVPLIAILPAAAIIPIFKSSGSLMGKMTNFANTGVRKLGGDALLGTQKKANALLGKQIRQGTTRFNQNRQESKVDRARAEAEKHADEFQDAKSKIQAAKGKIFSSDDSLKLAQLRALGVRNDEQQKEMDRLSAKKTSWDAMSEKDKSLTLSNYNAAKLTRDKFDPEKAAARQRQTMGYRMANFNNLQRSKQAERERQDKARQVRALGNWLSDNSENKKVMQGYSGLAGATGVRRSEAMMDAFAAAQEIGDKEAQDKVMRSRSLLGNATVTRANGRKDPISNTEYADLYTGKLASLTVEINGKEVVIPGGSNMDSNMRKAAIAQMTANGWASPEVNDVALYAAFSEDDPYVRQAAISAAVQSGKAPVWLGGGAVPAVMAGKIERGEQGAILNFSGGIKGDQFGASVSASQMKEVFNAIALSKNHELSDDELGITVEKQDAYVSNLKQYLSAQLLSTNGYNLVNSVAKEKMITDGLITAGVDPTEVKRLIDHALGR